MNYYRYLSVVSLVALSLTGCKTNFKGGLTVYSNLAVYNKDNQPTYFSPGSYSLELTYHTVRKFLEFKAGSARTVKIPVPSGALKEDGNFTLSAHQIKQNFDVQGTRSTDVSRSSTVPGTQSCILGSHTVIIGYDAYGFPIYSTVYDYGVQDTLEHVSTTHHRLNLNLVAAGTRDVLAVAQSDSPESQTVVDAVTSGCR